MKLQMLVQYVDEKQKPLKKVPYKTFPFPLKVTSIVDIPDALGPGGGRLDYLSPDIRFAAIQEAFSAMLKQEFSKISNKYRELYAKA